MPRSVKLIFCWLSLRRFSAFLMISAMARESKAMPRRLNTKQVPPDRARFLRDAVAAKTHALECADDGSRPLWPKWLALIPVPNCCVSARRQFKELTSRTLPFTGGQVGDQFGLAACHGATSVRPSAIPTPQHSSQVAGYSIPGINPFSPERNLALVFYPLVPFSPTPPSTGLMV